MNIIDNTQIYINLLDVLKCKCKVLFSIMTAIIRHIYKDYIKNSYNYIYIYIYIYSEYYGKKEKEHQCINNK